MCSPRSSTTRPREASLVAAHRELSDCSEASLLTLERAGRRAADVVAVHRAVRDRLAADWYDEVDLMHAATAAVEAGASVLDDVGTVVLHLPQDLAPAPAQLVRTLATRCPVHVVAGLTGVAAADADVQRTLERLGAPPAETDVAPPLVVDRVVSVSDADEEARTAVEQVLAAMREDATPAERIAVVYPSPEPYAPILAEHLAAAGITWNGHADRATRQRLAPRWLLDVLDLPDLDWSRSAVLGVLGGGRAGRSRQLPVHVHVAERLSRAAGVTGSIEGWLDRLTRFADQAREEAELQRARPDRGWLADRRDREADDADALRATVVGLAASLEQGAKLTTWAELAAWVRELLHDHLGGEQERADWPVEERRAADDVEAALDRIGALDGVEDAADLGRLRRTLELELDTGLGRTGALGQGVLVGRPSDTLGVDLDLVVVLGLSEGVFPSRPREDSLLAEHEREAVHTELPPRHTRVATQQRHLLAALASARRRVLVHPRGDLRRSVDRAPSRWLLDALEATTGQRRLDPDDDLVTVVPSYADRVVRAPVPSDDQAFGVRALAADPRRTPAPTWLGSFAAGRRLLHARASDAFTAFDGNLAEVADLAGAPGLATPTSASALEAWVTCPHGYLVNRVLGVEPVEDPEERLDISPLEYGSLVHAVLEAWVNEQLESGTPAPDVPWSGPARTRLHAIADQLADQWQAAGATGHPRLWEVRLAETHRLLDAFLDDDDRVRSERCSAPVATELAFGPGADQPPVEVDLGDGRTVRLRGFIDRVDRTADGGVVVVDYKTGSTRAYEGLGVDAPMGDGTHLQLLVYALAARQAHPDATSVRAEYHFVGARDTGTRIGYEVGPDAEQALVDVVRLVVDHAGAGVFPHHPAPPVFQFYTPCLYCDPDELGTADRHREWERLRLHPDLHDYVRPGRPRRPRRPGGRPVTTELADAAARRLITGEDPAGLDRTLFVEAGAGSGKTGSLVRRVLALVAHGVELRHVAAITFTEKAAAELRDRIRVALERRAADEPPGILRDRYRTALEQVDMAALSTLHSFAQRLLTEYPVEAGLPPNVELLDEVSSEIEFQRRWRVHRDAILADDHLAEVVQLGLAAGMRFPDDVRQLALEFERNWDLVTDPTRLPPVEASDGVPTVDVGELVDALDAVALRRQECTDPSDALYQTLECHAARLADELRHAPDDATRLRLLDPQLRREVAGSDAPVSFKWSKGRKGNWPDGAKDEIAAAGRDLIELRDRLRQTAVDGLLHRLAVSVGEFVESAARDRVRQGRLEFHDLLVLARRLLQRPVGTRGPRGPARPLPAAAPRRVPGHRPDPGRAGRPARLGRRRRRRGGVAAGPHRPRPAVLRRGPQAVHLPLPPGRHRPVPPGTQRVRRRGPGPPVDQLPHRPRGHRLGQRRLRPPRPSSPRDPSPSTSPWTPRRPARTRRPARPSRCSAPTSTRTASTPTSLREQEAADVADVVARAVGDRWQVAEKDDDDQDTWRDATYGDVTILLPARTSLPMLEDALAARGIPYRAESSSLVYATREVRDLLMTVRALADPSDQLALVAALRSHVFGCGDDDLLTWRREHGQPLHLLAPIAPDAPADHPVHRALADAAGPARRAGVDDARAAARPAVPRPPALRARPCHDPAPRRLAAPALRDRPGPRLGRGRGRDVARVPRLGPPPVVGLGARGRGDPARDRRRLGPDHDDPRSQGPRVPHHGPVGHQHPPRVATTAASRSCGRPTVPSASASTHGSPPASSTPSSPSTSRWATTNGSGCSTWPAPAPATTSWCRCTAPNAVPIPTATRP